jgi:hypothetical protein
MIACVTEVVDLLCAFFVRRFRISGIARTVVFTGTLQTGDVKMSNSLIRHVPSFGRVLDRIHKTFLTMSDSIKCSKNIVEVRQNHRLIDSFLLQTRCVDNSALAVVSSLNSVTTVTGCPL